MSGNDQAHDPAVLGVRVSNLEKVVEKVTVAVESIDTSLQTLARLEERHSETRNGLARAFAEISDHETRLRNIEAEMPTMKMVRGWVITGVVGILSLAGVALWSVITSHSASASPEIRAGR